MKVITFAWKLVRKFGMFSNIHIASADFAEFLLEIQGDIITNEEFRKRNEIIVAHKSSVGPSSPDDWTLPPKKPLVWMEDDKGNKAKGNSPEFEEVIQNVIQEMGQKV